MNKENGFEYDLLTDVYSRWRCRIDLQQILDNGGKRVIGTIDLDNFKYVNDKFGSMVGDNLLKAIAKALCDSYPDSDIYRISADEFAFILAPTTYSRYRMSEMTLTLFDNLHKIKVEGMEGHHLTFSIGTLFIDTSLHFNPDQIYQEVSACRRKAKKHEGTFLYSKYGFIPDIEGAFLILREDRHLYNSINNRLFSIYNEEDWVEYLDRGAMLKGDMFRRNQSQLDDILAYYKAEDLPSFDYYLLYDVVFKYADTLDSFMYGILIENILLPFFEKQNRNNPDICGRLGNLYLMLADSLVTVVRMGDNTQRGKIIDLLAKCREVTRYLDHDTIEFEPYFYALCHLVGHYESIDLNYGTIDDCNKIYDELRNLIEGPDPIVLQDQLLIDKYDNLVNNARLFPLYRASYLLFKNENSTDEEKKEFKERIEYIKQHLVNGVYDLTSKRVDYQNMSKYLQDILLGDLSKDQILSKLLVGLRTINKIEYGKKSSANLMLVTYIYMGAAKAVIGSSHSESEKRVITMAGLDMLIDLLRQRESMASDHQVLFMTKMMMSMMMSSPVLSPVDKIQYIERTMGAIMLDTYSHSKAVAAYAKVILANIIDNSPHLLTGENRPYNNITEVQANRQELLDFMDCACMLHDVGKINITQITSNAYRKLTDQEFNLIHQHPAEGVKILSVEPAFDVFRPFVYTHHLWVNRGAGYPKAKDEDFSPRLQFLVYLMSFCDSLEAATSRIGRNYRNAKSFLQILDEFYVEAGTRYSDEILQSIIGSPDTYYQIRLMVDHKWKGFYQHIFQEVVLNKSHNHRFNAGTLPDIYANKPFVDDYRTRFSMLQRTEIINPLISLFDTVFYSNVEFTSFDMVKCYQKMLDATKSLKTTHEVIALTRDKMIDPEFRDAFNKFVDKNTVVERLKNQENTTLEYHSKTSGWVIARILPAAYDENGNISHILFATQSSEAEHQQKDNLAKFANFDGLTGVLNRRSGEQMIREGIAQGGTQIFALFDCDNFKKINDQLSHLVGDQVLREQSKILTEFFDGNQVMRLGGDEFVVYIHGEKAHKIVNSPNGLKDLFNDLSKRLSTVQLPELKNITPTMSCGVVFTDSSYDVTFESLYQHADESLRESKKLREGTITIKELRYLEFFH